MQLLIISALEHFVVAFGRPSQRPKYGELYFCSLSLYSPWVKFGAIGQGAGVVHCQHIAVLRFCRTAIGHTDHVHF